MKGIIDFEITKLRKKSEVYIPMFYAKLSRPLAYYDANFNTDYFETAKKVVSNTMKYIVENGCTLQNPNSAIFPKSDENKHQFFIINITIVR